MYATDAAARRVADAAIAAGHDRFAEAELQRFSICPSGTPRIWPTRTGPWSSAAVSVRATSRKRARSDIVRRFGRFPHRNAILGRPMTKAEEEYLANGGYTG